MPLPPLFLLLLLSFLPSSIQFIPPPPPSSSSSFPLKRSGVDSALLRRNDPAARISTRAPFSSDPSQWFEPFLPLLNVQKKNNDEREDYENKIVVGKGCKLRLRDVAIRRKQERGKK